MACVGVKSKQGTTLSPTKAARRRGGGRKRAKRSRVKHRPRERFDARTPVHVTARMLPDIARLRRRDQYRVVYRVLARSAYRHAFRICHYSIQSDHIHLVCEAADEVALARGMIGFETSCARRLNRAASRHGAVFADRYHARLLRTPAQVRRALCKVLNDWRRHGEDRGSLFVVDPFSSAVFFDGWRAKPYVTALWSFDRVRPVAPPRTWLLSIGWRRHGAIDPHEVPGR
jgi:REP element-mobilizing transposase RayT